MQVGIDEPGQQCSAVAVDAVRGPPGGAPHLGSGSDRQHPAVTDRDRRCGWRPGVEGEDPGAFEYPRIVR